MPPKALLAHKLQGRLRIKVAGKRGDDGYFAGLRESFSSLPGVERVEVDPLTASILVLHSTTPKAVCEYGQEQGLFRLERPGPPKPLTAQVARSYHRLNERVRSFSAGVLDIPSLALIALVSASAYQIAKRGLSVPAWYIALWYAMSIIWQTGTAGAKEAALRAEGPRAD